MALTASDGGGGIGGGFPGNPKYYDPGIVHGDGTGQVGGSPDAPSGWESAGRDLLLGPGGSIVADLFGEGAFDKVHNAMTQANPEQLNDMATAWGNVRTAADSHQLKLATAIGKLESAWEGDDADKALPIMRGLQATMARQVSNAANMQSAFGNMGSNMTSMKNAYGDGQSVGGFIGNAVTGSDDRAAANDYKQLMEAFKSDLGIVPETVPSEIKVDQQYNTNQTPATPGLGGPGGAPSVGGPGSAAHVGGPTSPNIGKTPQLEPDATLTHPDRNDDDDFTRPEFTDPPRTDYNPTPYDPAPYTGGGPDIGTSGGAGLDTDGSLAGLGGGGGALGGGAGAGGLGGIDPNAAGAGVGAGAGAGGGANGALGAGSGAGGFGPGAGGTAGGAAGVGGRGMMMPMHGQQGDEDERERTTWLSEDDDIWGAEENLPGVIH